VQLVAFGFLAKASCDFVVLCGEWKRLNHQGKKGGTKARFDGSQVELSPDGSKLKDIVTLTDAFSESVASREGQEGLEVDLKAGNRFWAHFCSGKWHFW